MKNNKGFTLIELIVVMAVFTIISAMTLTIFSFGVKSNQKNQDLQESTTSLRLVSRILEKDIRKSSQSLVLITDQAKPNCFKLKDIKDSEETDEEVSFKYCLKEDVLYRNDAFLIDKISSFEMQEIKDPSKETFIGVEIIIKNQEGDDYDQEIYFRN